MASPIDNGLTVRATGPATEAGRISLAELARITSTLQATLERLAFSIAGGRPKAGRRPQEIADAVRLDFTGFQHGSAVLELQRPIDRVLPFDAPSDDLLSESFNVLTAGINEIKRTGAHPSGDIGRHFNKTVLNGLVSLCAGIGKGSLTRIEFSSGDHLHFAFDAETQYSLRRIRRSTVAADTIITGRLHMGDFDPMSLRCRIDTNLNSVWCDFDIELKDAVFERLDQLVEARGTAELDADGVGVRVLHLTGISTVETASAKSLDELAREQNVSPLSNIDQLRGETVEDFDLFLEAIRTARGDE
ncbi:hypothetical protein [Actinophytocola sp. KF-1]